METQDEFTQEQMTAKVGEIPITQCEKLVVKKMSKGYNYEVVVLSKEEVMGEETFRRTVELQRKMEEEFGSGD